MKQAPSTSDFTSRIDSYRQALVAAFDRHGPSPEAKPRRLHQAMCYSLSAGGKRIRPILLMAVADALSCRINPLPAAVAVECLHTYSLIHDDLPAMDNSSLRRGKATCHCQFDEATAILAGDALLTYAFELLAREYKTSSSIALALVQELAVASGSQQLVGGQMEDIENTARTPTVDELYEINRKKTGALFSASATMGAIVAEADESTRSGYREFGAALGAAFQVMDDILDSTQSEESLGKTAGLDKTNQKITFVTLEGLKSAQKRAEEWTQKASALLSSLPGETGFLFHLLNLMTKRTH